MKIRSILLASILSIASILSTHAQTSALPGGLGQLASDAGAFLTDAQPYFGTNGLFFAGAGVLVNQKKVGGYADVNLFSLNQQVSIGFAGAYLNGNWYDASLSLKAGTTWQVPIIGPVYTMIESGPGYNFRAGHVVAHNFVIAHRAFTINDWMIDPHVGVGSISDLSGLTYLGGINIKPPGKW